MVSSACWINAVEGFIAKLTNRRLKRGVFHAIIALQGAINSFVKEANQSPKPFRWTKILLLPCSIRPMVIF